MAKRPYSTALVALALVIAPLILFTQLDYTPALPSRFCQDGHSFDLEGVIQDAESNTGVKGSVGGKGIGTDRLGRFLQGFPSLRTSEEQGIPESEPSTRPDFDWPSVRTMFAFGDSFTTNYYRPRENGIGDGRPETFWHLDHRLTDRTWTDWLWGMFKDTRTTRYYNLARAGATVSRAVLKPGKEEWGTFEDQIDDFRDLFSGQSASGSALWEPDSTLFLLFFGINDISQLDRMDEGVLPIEETCSKFAEALFTLSSGLHALGARHFLFLNAHPFYRSPKYNLPHGLGHDIQQRVVDSVTWFNEYFETQIDNFRHRHEDSNVFDFDLFRFMDIVLDYPQLFGLTDTERYLMRWEGMEDEEETEYGQMGFGFRDFQHPSWSMQNLIARSLNGLLLRHSSSLTKSNATEEGLYVDHPPVRPDL